MERTSVHLPFWPITLIKLSTHLYEIPYKELHKQICQWLYINYQLWCTDYYLFIKYYYNDPRSSYALHILNCRHKYGNINDTMTLLKQVNKPSILLPYEQMFIQSLHHGNELINEQQASEHNPMFELLRTEAPYVTNQ